MSMPNMYVCDDELTMDGCYNEESLRTVRFCHLFCETIHCSYSTLYGEIAQFD